MRAFRLELLLVGVAFSVAAARADDLKLAEIFSDHMVLQRDKPVPVWGWAAPGEEVVVSFAGQQQSGTADTSGKWKVKFAPMAASDKPRNMQVGTAAQPSALVVHDVLVGEVWLGSGQSNMAMTVDRAQNPDAEKEAARLPLVRMFKETSKAAQSPQRDGQGDWTVCSPDTVGGYSATLYFFGREVHRELGVPVGLINSSVGGTPIEAWISAEAQLACPELKNAAEAEAKAFDAFDEKAAMEKHAKALERWKQLAAKAKADGQPAPRKPKDPRESRNRRGGPGGLFNGKIAPLIPYGLRGVVWYQGEANSHPGKGPLYQYQLPLLVSDWRTRWGEELPFAWVQLPNFNRAGEGWCLVREAMLKSLKVPHTGMAITVDIGDPKDIHPKNKQEAGRRLALWALGTVYGKQVPATSGPLPAGHKLKDGAIEVSFTQVGGGLQAKGGPLKGFEIAGEDRQWKAAQARIDGEKVVVSNSEVKRPVAVRYAWQSNPDCNLVSAAGLPASPFRTDDWPTAEAGK